jgi:2-amino-4-hydroxy-6-hydroxymethyldihydropteridine diphosphokinase
MGHSKNRELISYLSIGSNLGDRKKNLDEAINHLKSKAGFVINTSKVYESEPWGLKDQNFFLNQVIKLKTTFSPQDLLKCCKNIEVKMGRSKSIKWGERNIDIDILYFSKLILNEDDLKIPHPLIQERKFVLLPLNELNKTFIHPSLNKTNYKMLEDCIDNSNIFLYGNK